MRFVPWMLLAGVVVFHALDEPPPALVVPLLALPLLARRYLAGRCLLVACAGFAWTWAQVELRLAERLSPELEGRVLEVRGVVVAPPEQRGGALRMTLETLAVAGEPRRLRVRLTWYGAEATPLPGERWRLSARLRRPRGFANPGSFDYERWLFERGIGATGYVLAGAREGSEPVCCALARVRLRIADRLRSLLADAGQGPGALVIALAVGLRTDLTPSQWEVLSVTGTAHLMAISGLHVGLVAAMALLLVRRAWGWLPGYAALPAPMDAAAVAALAAACGYAALAGFSLPTQRALIMLAVVVMRTLLRRECSPWLTLGQALTLVLAIDPLAPLSAGFWLSFLAVAAILFGARMRRRGGWLAVQLWVWLGMAPVTVLVFERVSLIAPLVNLALIPLFTVLVVPAVLAGVVASLAVPVLARWPVALAERVLDVIWPVLERLAAWPWAAWLAGERPLWALAAMQVGVLLMLAPRGFPGRWLGLIYVLPAIALRPPAPVPGSFELAVLDVGQGLAAVVRTHRHTLVYDAGPSFRSGADTGAMVVVPYLRARGVARLDSLIVSHGDSDHSGGVSSVERAFPPRRLLTGGGQLRGERCAFGQHWLWDGVRFDMLHPPERGDWHGNDGSCVLRVATPGGSALLTGDIEALGEAQLVRLGDRGGPLASTIIVAPHHGSATSSTPPFVAAARADFVVYSTGYANRWGFPLEDVTARWRAAGAHGLDTAVEGAVVFGVGAAGIETLYLQRRDARRYWTAH